MNRIHLIFWVGICILLACQTPNRETVDFSLLESDENYLDEASDGPKIVVYQMMTRLFGNTKNVNKPHGTLEENGVGKFEDISTKALEELKNLGATHIWYTGILEHATMTDYSAEGIALDDADVVKGRAGSPYAIKDYYDVNPDLAVDVSRRMEEFEALMQRTHETGLKVLIDFVPNHVARGYTADARPEGIPELGSTDDLSVSFSPTNNFYYLVKQPLKIPSDYDPLGSDNSAPLEDGRFSESPAKVSGNDVFSSEPKVWDWFETIKLNYGIDYQNERTEHFDPIPPTWERMREILSYWAEKGVDGFRCDMAEMVPVAFWEWVIPQIKTINPSITFTAEIYTPDRYLPYVEQGQFDYLYDKVQLYDTLKSIIRQSGSTHHLPPIWKSLKGLNGQMLRFLENHDEQRIASADFAGQPQNALPAMLVSATLYTGPVMIYFGQEVGEPGLGVEGFGGEDGRTTIFDYWGVPEHQKWVNGGEYNGGQLSEEQKNLRSFYQELLNFSTQNEAISSGKLYDLQEHHKGVAGYSDKVYSYLRFTENQRLWIMVNFDTQQAVRTQMSLPEQVVEALALPPSFSLMGKLGTQEKWAFDKGVEVVLPPLAAYIFEF